ncbi:TrkH family potassium uptake protein [Pseudolysinimonas sp.]|uniref:TrkH family potassium uptake protein n=1 Tax=Pseudolysinimonas sp. TaxID=2680009 RepID=UPI003F7F758F
MGGMPARSGPWTARLADAIGDFSIATPARFAILVFAGLTAVFTILFSLPIATASGDRAPLVDALFTAISVVCVTGLSTVDMATFWSPLGHVFVFVGVEIGGIGVLTLASILGLIISRKLGLRQKLLAAGDANPLSLRRGVRADGQALKLGETGGLVITVAISVLVIELAAAVLLFPRMLLAGADPWTAGWQSVYTAAMAFTNTGFLPSSEGLAPYAHDAWFLVVLMLAVGFGAIGFPVIHTLARRLRRPRTWSLHVKLTIATFLLLLVGGAVAFLALQWNGEQAGLDPGQRILQSFFQSSMARSGGFSTVDYAHLDGASLFVADMLMFVGGGSASTAGGIKVTTLAILFLGAIAEARGVDDMEAYRRRIPSDVMRLAVSVVLWGATTVAAATITLLVMTGARLDFVLFDVISAFATCGLSTGFTASASEPAQYVLAATMFLGRIGTVTIAAALAASTRRQLFRRPEERPIVG